jgi:hypothetical protein
MDDRATPSHDRSVKEIKELTEAPVADETKWGLSALKRLSQRVRFRMPIPDEEPWSSGTQPCSESKTIAAMNETLSKIVSLLNAIIDRLPSSTQKRKNQ